ncbi:DEAD/DEAH box helicase [Endozoicomonas sp. ONNA2]|uniref:DEAD/DEAH box helicase n=1 Tax=Endozoicomonas sp. ONNA2 TaxID=2828741 RepID=UPI0021480608|nr:DEAD/DEAH box helicase [Endozoicomonas sp. ONNA2]
MLPATLAQEVRKQIQHYLGATFHMRQPESEQALQKFFNHPEDGLFKGPWVQVKRPFRLAGDSGSRYFDLHIPFTPFLHQKQSWARLTSKGNKPKHTIVTTGTGSGKTECFLYPLLDHCYRARQAGQNDGIKAIILYPMNALASDQAGRFAEEILTSDQLSYLVKGERKARIRIGLYTGRMTQATGKGEGAEPGTYQEMTIIPPENGRKKETYVAITNRANMQENPPDILLTNYKMLDYLLLRPKDQDIWRHNQLTPELLQYLVLDELHTYDGAQGADVACLLRRLKARLDIPANHLCMVGTSATIAGGDEEQQMDSIERLCEFASSLFEESITTECVIKEDRYKVEEIVRIAFAVDEYPDPKDCEPREKEDAPGYACRMAELFGAPANPMAMDNPWLLNVSQFEQYKDSIETLDSFTRRGLAIGEWLRCHPLFHGLLTITQYQVAGWTQLLKDLSKNDFVFRGAGSLVERGQLLMAFLALVAQARELRSGRAFPLVPTQVQFWLRELRRVGSLVTPDIAFSWLDEPTPQRKQLPVAHCTECGEIAWAALTDPDMESVIQQHCQGFQLKDDVQAIYQGWGFDHPPSQRLVLLSPWKENDDPIREDGQQLLEGMRWHLAPNSLVVRQGPGKCPLTDEATFPVKVSREIKTLENGSVIGRRLCPHCQAEDALMFIGSRAATIASVAIDEVFGSVLNSDAKLLAFTDSVQDASHRAGFFSSRTYHFTLRTALQHIIDEAGDTGLPLEQVGEHLLAYWSRPEPGRPGSERRVIETLIPPDLREYKGYVQFRKNSAALKPDPKLRKEFITRLNWQAASEFSLMLTHGRTMEINASATLGWDDRIIEDTIDKLQLAFPAISPSLEALDRLSIKRWIYGVIHRQRERGGLYHPYLDQYAAQNMWGKFNQRGQALEYRESYPGSGRYKPKMLVTTQDRYHDFALAAPRSGSLLPWQLLWARRALGSTGLLSAMDDASLVDLMARLLKCGTEAGLFHCVHVDGNKSFYALNSGAALLYPTGKKLLCQQSNHILFRPLAEAKVWENSPSLSYQAQHSLYQPAKLNDREKYYRERYRKGALRRVFAHEHTGLLTTDERENLEMSFNAGGHGDDPNVLTATSTLEMGIDIGDLSTTMLCSIPPSTASYLQRIGRAGRKTGTALVLSVINQRPHDLFFYARPEDLLCGDVEPPGCWLDASAVLVRQYLAFCFDQGVRHKVLTDLPATGKQLVDELIVNKSGNIPQLLDWMLTEEHQLQHSFLERFKNNIQEDTRERFCQESRVERLREKIELAAAEFNMQRSLLHNAQNRLKDQKSKLDATADQEDLAEIQREEKILRARRQKLGEISALEVLTEHGLLPNYAFPERGVRFSGSTYNKHAANDPDKSVEKPPIELVRAASSAIRELAPANHFYTRSHKFDVQQLEIGSRSQPLLEKWAICGQCGHMRLSAEVDQPDAIPACPQCGFDGPSGQCDKGQHKDFLPFQRSQAISYMEYYDSLSGDNAEERENEFYTIVPSFDQTIEQASGAVGEDDLPFGIEYRAAMMMREVNAGYSDLPAELDFGQDKKVPDHGFEVCEDCGVIVSPGKRKSEIKHRRSCSGHRESQKRKREGRADEAYRWKGMYLYRELRSEAIRLMLPDVEQEDLDTLEAAIYLGMRLRFQGDPAHLMVKPQVIPDHAAGITRHYLVLLDAVPGGTGFLKALFQDDNKGATPPAEGIMHIMQLALNALETCSCRKLPQTEKYTDGCYRCIRTYHMQHKSENISSERGINLLRKLLVAGAKREVKQALDDIKVQSIFGSVLEKRFVNKLQCWVEELGGSASWRSAIIAGTEGFEFTLGDSRWWSLELQPMLGAHQNVSVKCQPDFMLRCDDPEVKPVAIFTDGFEPHVKPGEQECRLADDLKKRRAILESHQYLVWNIAWNDLDSEQDKSQLTFLQPHVATRVLTPLANKLVAKGKSVPAIEGICANPFEQFKTYLKCPVSSSWKSLAQQIGGLALLMLASQGIGQDSDEMNGQFQLWRAGYAPPPLTTSNNGNWVWVTKLALNEDLLTYGVGSELVTSDFTNLRMALRLGDSFDERKQSGTYLTRWRQFLAMMNLFQFADSFIPFTTSEVEADTAPDLTVEVESALSDDWVAILEETVPSLVKAAKLMAAANKVVPEVEFYNDDLPGDLSAELAWPDAKTPVALLTGDQASFAEKWQAAGWIAITDKEIKTRGEQWLLEQIPEQEV